MTATTRIAAELGLAVALGIFFGWLFGFVIWPIPAQPPLFGSRPNYEIFSIFFVVVTAIVFLALRSSERSSGKLKLPSS